MFHAWQMFHAWHALYNQDIQALNELARASLKAKGWIGKDESVFEIHRLATTPDGLSTQIEKTKKAFAVGDSILLRKTDNRLGLINGEFAKISKIENETLFINYPDKRTASFNVKAYPYFDYGYATSVHKTQGATFDNLFVYIGSQAWDRHLAYVALTRHKHQLEIHVDQRKFQSKTRLVQHLSQHEEKSNVLDWPIQFARRRGFDTTKPLPVPRG